MHVEDHPLEYGGFEGVIPARRVRRRHRDAVGPRHLDAEGDPGRRLCAGAPQVHARRREAQGRLGAGAHARQQVRRKEVGQEAWLLIKEKDEYARPGNGAVVDTAPDSVVTGRSLDEIAQAREHVWRSEALGQGQRGGRRGGGPPPAPRKASARAGRRAGHGGAEGRHAGTMLRRCSRRWSRARRTATDWISRDQVRRLPDALPHRRRPRAALLAQRQGLDDGVFRPSPRDLASLPVKSAWIDGEVVVARRGGPHQLPGAAERADGRGMRERTSRSSPSTSCTVDGYDLRGVPLIERKRLLREVVGRRSRATVSVGPEVRGGRRRRSSGRPARCGSKASISKRADSLYAAGRRTRDWVKVKCVQRQEMVIGGYTDPQGSRTGFRRAAARRLRRRQAALRGQGRHRLRRRSCCARSCRKLAASASRTTPPFVDPPRGFAAKGAHWVRPDLVAEVAFTEWSDDGALRHPSFQGLRLDKKATDVVRESARQRRGAGSGAAARSPAPRARRRRQRKRADPPDEVAGVALSHPDKVYFPEAGITKRDLAQYYASDGAVARCRTSRSGR